MAETFDNTLSSLCQQIHDEGHQPSVALLRAKAPYKISVAQAISAIQSFNGSKPINREVTRQPTVKDLEKRVCELESVVAILQKQINDLQ